MIKPLVDHGPQSDDALLNTMVECRNISTMREVCHEYKRRLIISNSLVNELRNRLTYYVALENDRSYVNSSVTTSHVFIIPI
jgi:hypothetical protein